MKNTTNRHERKNSRSLYVFYALVLVALTLSGVMFTSCKQSPVVSISEFGIDKQFCREHLVPEKLYRIDTQDEMDALFPEQSLYSLDNIDFTKHTVLLVYGVVLGDYTQAVEWEKAQPNEYVMHVNISVGIAAVASSTWAVACITDSKLSNKDNVTLDLSISNPDKDYE